MHSFFDLRTSSQVFSRNCFFEGTVSKSFSFHARFPSELCNCLSMFLCTCMKIYCQWKWLLSHVATLPQRSDSQELYLPPKHADAVWHTAPQTWGSERRNIGGSHIYGKHTTAYQYKINVWVMKQPYFPLPLGVMICTLNSECIKPALFPSLLSLYTNIPKTPQKTTEQSMLQSQVFI